eukprot:scaffold9000_cov139-Isochrysis_galbana.AAC.5
MVNKDEQLERKKVSYTTDESWGPAAALVQCVAHPAPAFHSEEVAEHRNLRVGQGDWAHEGEAENDKARGYGACFGKWAAECTKEAV